jgi:hypothetical protein
MRRSRLPLALALALVAVQPALGRTGGIDDVTLFADRTLLEAQQSVRLRGTIDVGQRDEVVEIEVKDCGQPSFRGVRGTSTEQGGEYSLEYWPGISTTIRAAWRNQKSTQIPVRQRAWVSLSKKRSTEELAVWIKGKRPFWRKHVLFQRRAGGSWKTVRRIVLTEQIGDSYGLGSVNTGEIFRARVPKGTLVRAVLPRSQARPCYLAGVSNTVRA